MAAHQLTVTPDGQISIPEELRHELGIDGGDHIFIERDATGLHIMIEFSSTPMFSFGIS